jgi:hypothetical protein
VRCWNATKSFLFNGVARRIGRDGAHLPEA